MPTFGVSSSSVVLGTPDKPAAVTTPFSLDESFDARVVPFAPVQPLPPVDEPPPPPVEPLPLFFAPAELPPTADEPVFDTGVSALTGKVQVVPEGLELPKDFLDETPLPDPFEEPLAAAAGGGDDVFEFPRPAAAVAVELEAAEMSPAGEMPDETAAAPEPEFVVALSRGEEVPSVAGEVDDATAKALAQRVVPRLLAQVGEVRELELEVPVPAVWTGGRRLTLQFRLTLIPEEETHAD